MVKKIIVVGGGNAGYSVAVAIKKINPGVDVHIFYSKEIPTLGVGESTVPQVATFYTAFLGYDQTEFMRKTDTVFKFANKLENFVHNKGEYTYFGFSYNLQGDDLLNGFFHQYDNNSFRNVVNNKDRYTDYFIKLYNQNRLKHNDINPYINEHFGFLEQNKCPFSNSRYLANNCWSWAYHTDANKITGVLKETAKKIHIVEHECNVEPIIENNICKGISDGTVTHTADLYIDASGFSRVLFSKLDNEWQDYPLIPVNKAWLVNSNYSTKEKQMTAYTRSIAMNAGWRFEIALYSRIGNGYVFSPKHISDEDAYKELEQQIPSSTWIHEPRLISWRPGRYKKAAVSNLISAGIATGFFEPLLSNALYLSVSSAKKIALLVQKCNGSTDIAELIEDYNQSTDILYTSIYDFLAATYKFTSRDDTSFWREQNEMGKSLNLIEKIKNQYYSVYNNIENNINGYSIFPDFMWINLAAHFNQNINWMPSYKVDENKLNLAEMTFKYIKDKSVQAALLSPTFYEWHRKYIYNNQP